MVVWLKKKSHLVHSCRTVKVFKPRRVGRKVITPHLSYSAISAAGNFCFYPDFKGIQPFDPFVTGLQNLTIDPSNEAVVPHLSQNDYDSRLTFRESQDCF